MKLKNALLISSLMVFTSSLSHAENTSKVPYPDNYHSWTHVKSMVIEPGHPLANPFEGIHHVYGNDKAISGLKNGSYSDGSIFVFDLLKYQNEGHTLSETERKLVGVMQKDSKEYSKTGGWGFEGFAANSRIKRLTNDGGTSCFVCHTPKKDDDYVFSKLRK